MAFYIIFKDLLSCSWFDNYDKQVYFFEDRCILNFSDKNEKDAFLKKYSSKGINNDILLEIKSLVYMLSYFYMEHDSFDIQYPDSKLDAELAASYYLMLSDLWGEELLNQNFPNESFNDDLINLVLKQLQEYLDEADNAYFDAMEKWKDEYEDTREDKRMEDLNDDMTRNWDEETGGSWRDANDFG